MKKIIAFILSWICYFIGNILCDISYMKIKRKNKEVYWFDGPENSFRMKLGFWLSDKYQIWMLRSLSIQEWAGNKTPWKDVDDE
jgi:hypothetical protein